MAKSKKAKKSFLAAQGLLPKRNDGELRVTTSASPVAPAVPAVSAQPASTTASASVAPAAGLDATSAPAAATPAAPALSVQPGQNQARAQKAQPAQTQPSKTQPTPVMTVPDVDRHASDVVQQAVSAMRARMPQSSQPAAPSTPVKRRPPKRKPKTEPSQAQQAVSNLKVIIDAFAAYKDAQAAVLAAKEASASLGANAEASAANAPNPAANADSNPAASEANADKQTEKQTERQAALTNLYAKALEFFKPVLPTRIGYQDYSVTTTKSLTFAAEQVVSHLRGAPNLGKAAAINTISDVPKFDLDGDLTLDQWISQQVHAGADGFAAWVHGHAKLAPRDVSLEARPSTIMVDGEKVTFERRSVANVAAQDYGSGFVPQLEIIKDTPYVRTGLSNKKIGNIDKLLRELINYTRTNKRKQSANEETYDGINLNFCSSAEEMQANSVYYPSGKIQIEVQKIRCLINAEVTKLPEWTEFCEWVQGNQPLWLQASRHATKFSVPYNTPVRNRQQVAFGYWIRRWSEDGYLLEEYHAERVPLHPLATYFKDTTPFMRYGRIARPLPIAELVDVIKHYQAEEHQGYLQRQRQSLADQFVVHSAMVNFFAHYLRSFLTTVEYSHDTNSAEVEHIYQQLQLLLDEYTSYTVRFNRRLVQFNAIAQGKLSLAAAKAEQEPVGTCFLVELANALLANSPEFNSVLFVQDWEKNAHHIPQHLHLINAFTEMRYAIQENAMLLLDEIKQYHRWLQVTV